MTAPSSSEGLGPATVDPAFEALLNSDRVSERTRSIMARRALPDRADYQPAHLSREALVRLRSLVDRVLPQETVLGTQRIDLAARIDQRLGMPGDGWRFAILPLDAQAYQQALDTLGRAAKDRFKASFETLRADQQDTLLSAMASGTLNAAGLNAQQMQAWFSDLRADAVQLFISHPAVQGVLGIDAVANGGDGFFQGFQDMGEGVNESWEPAAHREIQL